MKVIFPATIEKIATRVDKTIAVTLGSQELTNDDAGRLFQMRGKYCKVLLSDDNINTLEEEMVVATAITGTKKKTPSARLRGVFFRLHEQSGLQIPFDDWYAVEMEKIILHFKGKLDGA